MDGEEGLASDTGAPGQALGAMVFGSSTAHAGHKHVEESHAVGAKGRCSGISGRKAPRAVAHGAREGGAAQP